jgi:hypothetical protein
MKNLLLILLAAIGLISCNSDDENTSETISGEWTLRSGNGTISGRVDTFDDGQITWTFSEDNTVDVVNTVTDPQLLSGPATGIYSYTVNNNTGTPDCPKTISIGNGAFQCSSITTEEIRIGDGFADGVYYTFGPMPQIVPF